ncbi:MAG: hypothetical protein ACRDJH_15700 [Thermomicrobiales bacterium]
MQDQAPIVGRPRGANGRALQAEGIVWEGQVLIAGDGIDLAARLIVTADRVAFARGGTVALDAPRAWLRPAPAMLPDGSLRFTIAPGDGTTEELLVVPSDGRRAATRLVSLLAGSEFATPARSTNGHAWEPPRTEPPLWPERSPTRPVVHGEPLPEPPSRPSARHVSQPMPERWSATPDLNTLAVLDPDDFPSLTGRPRHRGHDFDPLPPWRSQEDPAPESPAATRGAQAPATMPSVPTEGGIPRHTAWLQPIDLSRPNRRGRAGWAIRLSGLVLLLVAAALFGTGRLPDNPGRDLASRLPAQTRETLGIEFDDPTPTPTAQPTPPPAPTGQPAAPDTVAEDVAAEPTTPPVPTSVAMGVGADTTAESVDSTATATLTQEPPPPTATLEPTATPTPEPTVTQPPEPTPTPTTEPEEEVEVAVEPVEMPQEAVAEPTSTPEPPAPTATPTNTPEPAPTSTPTEEPPPPTATTEPTAEPTDTPTDTPTAEPTTAPTEAPEATPTTEPSPTATSIPTVTPSPTPGRIPPQAATLGEGEIPAPVVASGAFRYTITSARRGAELPDLALPATPGVEWVVLLMTAQNWGDETATLTMDDFRLSVTAPNDATVPLDATSGAVAQFLGFVPAYRASDAVLFASGETHQLALVFLVDPAAERLQLLAGETAINLDGALGSGDTAAAAPELVEGTVVEAVDGNTILVEVDGERGLVRYSGIAAPTGDDCYAAEATEANRTLVEGQTVWLERQRRNTAGDDALTRDVWIATDGGGRRLVAQALVAQGAAVPAIKEPDTRFAAWLETARAMAEANGAGLWGACDASASPESAAVGGIDWSNRGAWQRRALGWSARLP